MLDFVTSALKGTTQTLRAHARAMAQKPGIDSGVAQLQAICPPDASNDSEEPIFLLSAGWRSGSTLLQRLIMSDSRVIIWGEPFDECGMIQALAGSMKAFRTGWPPKEYYYDGTPPGQLSGEWIANLFPSLEDFRKGQRALFDAMFSEPAKRAGASRWGIKEVRFGAEHCAYLRWLYPKARFVFLYRDPLEAYISYSRYGRSWYDVFPDKPVFTPTAFGLHWRKIMEGFLSDAEKLDAILVKYEDLVSGRAPLDELETRLGIRVDRSLLQTKVGSSDRGGEKTRIGRLERWLLARAVAPIAEQLGYKR